MVRNRDIVRAVRRPWLPLLLTLLLCVPALYPLLLPGFVEGNDGVEHVFRVLALATAWRQSDIAGNLLPRWIPNLALGFGYPLFGVYSPLAYVFPAALTLLGVAPILAVKCAVGLALLAAGLGAYLALRPFTGPVAAVAGAVTYVYAPYTLANAYVRLDLAELSAMAGAALAVAMLLRLVRGGAARPAVWRRVVPAAVALAAVPLCHNLSALTFLPLFALIWLVLLGQAVLACRRAGPTSKTLGRASALRVTFPLFAVPLLALALAAFFLLPAWRWQASTHLALIPDDPAFYAKLLHPLALAQRRFAVPGWGWFGAGSAWWNFSVAPSPQGEFGAGPSSLAWLAVPVALLASRRLSGRRRVLVVALLVAGALSVLLMTSLALPLWRAAAHLTLLQFPWRFAGPLCLITALLIGMLLTLAPPRWRAIPAAACIALAMLPALVYLRPDPIAIPAGAVTWPAQMRRELIGGYGTTGSGLFLPRWVAGHSPAVPALPPPAPGATDLHFTALTGRADAFTARYQAAQPVTLTLGEWYFPGWRVQVDGHALASAPGAGGLLRVVAPAGSHQLTIARGITTSELAGGLITLAGVLASVVFLFGLGRLALILATVATLIGIGLLGVFSPLSFSALVGRGPAWSIPVVAPGRAVQPAAWRVVESPAWGATPVLEVAWLGERAPAGNDVATLQVTTPDGHVLATVTRGPRVGTVSTTNWPAGMLLFDHLPIPLPTRSGGVCGGTYYLTLAMGSGGAPATRLGSVTLPCTPVPLPSVAQVATSTIKGLSAGPLPAIQPGGTLSLDLTLRVPGPTATDEVLAFQLLDHTGRPVAQVQSYGNVDLRFSTLWRAGQSVPYTLRLALPGALAPGVYRLSLQRFSPASGKVAPLAGSAGQTGQNLTLATVKVAAPHVVPAAEPVARFAGSIGLLAPAGAVPVLHGQAGASVSVPLRWLALVPPRADYTVFVHLLDATGKLVAQADGPPLAGGYPTSAWGQGEVIDDPRTLQLPANLPPGRYAVHVGWYLPATGARLTVTPALKDNAVVVAGVVVGATVAQEAVRVP